MGANNAPLPQRREVEERHLHHAIRAGALQRYSHLRSDVSLDNDAEISVVGNQGAYVAAWVWVPFSDLERAVRLVCRHCGEDVAPDTSPGVYVHFDANGDVDHDADAEHVAIPEPAAVLPKVTCSRKGTDLISSARKRCVRYQSENYRRSAEIVCARAGAAEGGAVPAAGGALAGRSR